MFKRTGKFLTEAQRRELIALRNQANQSPVMQVGSVNLAESARQSWNHRLLEIAREYGVQHCVGFYPGTGELLESDS